MPDELELRLQPLPKDEVWEESRRRAREVFDIRDFDTALLTAANVAALAGRVTTKADAARDACHSLVREVRLALARLNVADDEIAQAPRYRTARAVDALLTGLAGLDATPALECLAGAKVETSGPAMALSVARAAGVTRELHEVKWGLFTEIAQFDEPSSEAERIIRGLREVIAADEYVQPLGTRLVDAQAHAIRYLGSLAKKRKDDNDSDLIDPRPVPRKGWKKVDDGTTIVGPENWHAEVARLERLLNAVDGCRIILSWSVERREDAP
jgi:hypothetical protein